MQRYAAGPDQHSLLLLLLLQAHEQDPRLWRQAGGPQQPGGSNDGGGPGRVRGINLDPKHLIELTAAGACSSWQRCFGQEDVCRTARFNPKRV
jgi:hypothetical protein